MMESEKQTENFPEGSDKRAEEEIPNGSRAAKTKEVKKTTFIYGLKSLIVFNFPLNFPVICVLNASLSKVSVRKDKLQLLVQ